MDWTTLKVYTELSEEITNFNHMNSDKKKQLYYAALLWFDQRGRRVENRSVINILDTNSAPLKGFKQVQYSWTIAFEGIVTFMRCHVTRHSTRQYIWLIGFLSVRYTDTITDLTLSVR